MDMHTSYGLFKNDIAYRQNTEVLDKKLIHWSKKPMQMIL